MYLIFFFHQFRLNYLNSHCSYSVLIDHAGKKCDSKLFHYPVALSISTQLFLIVANMLYWYIMLIF